MLKFSKNMLGSTIVATGLAILSATVAPESNATQIIGFGQSSGSNTVSITNPTATTSLLSIFNAAIGVTNFLGGGAPFAAFMNLSASSTAVATVLGGAIDQHFSGTFCISAAIGCTGTRFLYGSFIDNLSGQIGGASLTLSASTPPGGNVTFNSDVLTAAQLAAERGFALSLSNVTPANALCGGATICASTSSFTGTASAQIGRQVPEPATLALIGIALAGLGFGLRKQV